MMFSERTVTVVVAPHSSRACTHVGTHSAYVANRAHANTHISLCKLHCDTTLTKTHSGHSPSEAFNETVEEATQSLYPLIGENGMDWMYANCSTTAQRGALDWYPKFRDATKPVFEKLYSEVANGNETARTLDVNSKADYQVGLDKELKVCQST